MSCGIHFHILTLFPEMVSEGLASSILGRAIQNGHISLETVNIRDYTVNKHKKVDDYPYGGGAGMLMQAQPVYDACMAVEERIRARRAGETESAGGAEHTGTAGRARVIYVTPQGRRFNQSMAEELAKEEDLIFLCGHYEGIDERVLETVVTDQVSIGDYVLTGGELPAMVMIDAISRMVPGVLKNEESAEFESFHDNLLEYPQYTRPEIWRGMSVPKILLSGDHAKIEAWRLEQSEERTRRVRPELYEIYSRKERALGYLMRDKLGHMDMIEAIRRGQAHIQYADEEGVLLKDEPSGAWMVSAVDVDMGERLLSLIPRKERDHLLLVVHQKFLVESIARRFGKTYVNVCRQAVYTRKTAPWQEEDFCIHTIQEEEVDAVYHHYAYHGVHSKEDLAQRIRAGEMYGLYEDGQLAAFGGFHPEGSMGMLEVLPAYRRKGYGAALERYLIARALEKGRTPFCQVFEGNEPSLNLQKKLGLRLASSPLYWIS